MENLLKKPELLVDAYCMIGEGPCYDKQKNLLYWVDLLGNSIYSYSFSEKRTMTMQLDQNVGCVVVRKKGGLVAALQNGYYFVDIIQKKLETIADPESSRENNRFNDGKCDCMGRFWAGTMSKDLDTGYGEYKPESSLYCLYPDLHYELKIDGVILSNGMGWSPDNQTMYYIDTPRMEIAAYDFEIKTGNISNRRVAVRIPESLGMPDGMCVDAEGLLWVALWGGGAVTRWNPGTGKLIGRIDMPAINVSSCAFGGEDMDELFITTARIGTDTSEYPEAGGLFKIKPGVAGLESYNFNG